MAKKLTIMLFLGTILSLLTIYILKTYNNYKLDTNNIITYPYTKIDLKAEKYLEQESSVNEDNIFILFKTSDGYKMKTISLLDSYEEEYELRTDKECKIQDETNDLYISCKDENYIYVYDTKFTLIRQNILFSLNDYTLKERIFQSNDLNYPIVKLSKCNRSFFLIRTNSVTNKTSVFKDNQEKEQDIKYFNKYQNGIYSYDDEKIKIYNLNEDNAKEFKIPTKDIRKKLFTLCNDYLLYVLDDNIINIYDLYKGINKVNIDIKKIEEEITNMFVENNYLCIVTKENVYVFDITSLKEDTYEKIETDLINKKIAEYQNNYKVNVYAYEDFFNMHSDYDIKKQTNYTKTLNALSYLEDYFLMFNEQFFKRFHEYDMKGLNIYLSSDINGIKNGYENTDVVGISYKQNNQYIIILNIDNENDLLRILSHETMHIIDLYFELKNIEYDEWNNLNPEDFVYSHVYYPNVYFDDTLKNSKDIDRIYFIDNYARSSEKEDRGRLFEYICGYEEFKDYPNLNKKITYLKKVLYENFPELEFLK